MSYYDDISFDVIKELKMLEPYGESNPAPILVYKNIKVDGVRLLSNDKHLKLSLKDKGHLFDAIAFNMGDKRYSLKIGDTISGTFMPDTSKLLRACDMNVPLYDGPYVIINLK